MPSITFTAACLQYKKYYILPRWIFLDVLWTHCISLPIFIEVKVHIRIISKKKALLSSNAHLLFKYVQTRKIKTGLRIYILCTVTDPDPGTASPKKV
jgi:hypothetical protein